MAHGEDCPSGVDAVQCEALEHCSTSYSYLTLARLLGRHHDANQHRVQCPPTARAELHLVARALLKRA